MTDEKRADALASSRPQFLFVCDHGVRGGQLDRVALLPWFPDRPGWWAAKGVDEHAIRIWPLEGDQRGHDPKRIVEKLEPGDDDPRRSPLRSCAQHRIAAGARTAPMTTSYKPC